MILVWVPETKQRTLEELDYVFAVPTSRHASYQLFTAVPYWFKKYIFRQNVELPPLYHFDIHLASEQARSGSVVQARRGSLEQKVNL